MKSVRKTLNPGLTKGMPVGLTKKFVHVNFLA